MLIAVIGAFLLWRSLIRDHHAHSKDGKALAFVTGMIPCPLTTFIMSYALARGMLGAGLAVTAAMTVGMIATIGGIPWPLRLHEIAFWECSTAPKDGGTARERCWR